MFRLKTQNKIKSKIQATESFHVGKALIMNSSHLTFSGFRRSFWEESVDGCSSGMKDEWKGEQKKDKRGIAKGNRMME